MKIEDYNKYYIQGSDHYLIPKDEFKELFNEMVSWKQESQELKDNWNKLKEYCKNNYFHGTTIEVLEEMKKLEESDSNE